MGAVRWCRSVAWVLTVALVPAVAAAAPIKTRFPEGPTRGFLVLSDTAGKPLAHGELTQWMERNDVANRLVFQFADGSLYDETVRFSQRGVFQLLSYRLVQKGPSFTTSTDVEFDRTGRYRARTRDAPDEDEETASGRIDVPSDVSNGMASMLLKNLPQGASATTHVLAFTPQPRILEMRLAPEATDAFWLGATEGSAARYLAEPKVTGATGVVATVIGKQPPSVRFWLAQGKVPAFIRFEGPVYAEGPTWRIELAAPRWKH